MKTALDFQTAAPSVSSHGSGRGLLGLGGRGREEGEGKLCVSILKKALIRSSCQGSAETNLTSIHEDAGSIPGLAQWVEDPVLP